MKHLSVVISILLFMFGSNYAANDNDLVDYDTLFNSTSPRRNLNFTELCAYDGYLCENHTVTTDDGYLLSLFRLPLSSNCSNSEKLPLIFMHGLYLTGDDCIIPGPGKAHCYIYSDNCYDVWVPNNRGNRYGRNHVSLNPDKDSEFWNYSLDELAQNDLPAIIDYILDATNKEQVLFVGHSQGVTMLLLLCAKQPEYNNKVAFGVGLSTTSWLDYSRFIVIYAEGVLAPLLTTAVTLGGNGEFLAHGGLVNEASTLVCGLTTLSYPLCSVVLFAVLGYNKFQITEEVLPVVVGHIPGGTSIKNFNRWGQLKDNGFTEYSYGPIRNLLVYGSITPPEYNLTGITMPWLFIGSENDYVGDVTDTRRLITKMVNSDVTLHVLNDTTFGHLDFVYGKDIPNYITPKVLSVFEEAMGIKSSAN